MNFIQRIKDWLRERRIRRLSDEMKPMLKRGDYVAAEAHWLRIKAELQARSRQQIARMESRIASRIEQGGR